MQEFSNKGVEFDFSIDPESKRYYRFQFVIAYVQAHVPADVISELEGDRIMAYINGEWDLFSLA